jgi:hypothetical protein
LAKIYEKYVILSIFRPKVLNDLTTEMVRFSGLSLIATSLMGSSFGYGTAFSYFKPAYLNKFSSNFLQLGCFRSHSSPIMTRSLLFQDRQDMHQMRMSVSKEELTPGSDQMKARASKAMLRMGKQLLTPLEAANLIAGNRNELVESTSSEDDDDVFFIDVRTRQQRLDHEIIPGGVKVLT